MNILTFFRVSTSRHLKVSVLQYQVTLSLDKYALRHFFVTLSSDVHLLLIRGETYISRIGIACIHYIQSCRNASPREDVSRDCRLSLTNLKKNHSHHVRFDSHLLSNVDRIESMIVKTQVQTLFESRGRLNPPESRTLSRSSRANNVIRFEIRGFMNRIVYVCVRSLRKRNLRNEATTTQCNLSRVFYKRDTFDKRTWALSYFTVYEEQLGQYVKFEMYSSYRRHTWTNISIYWIVAEVRLTYVLSWKNTIAESAMWFTMTFLSSCGRISPCP